MATRYIGDAVINIHYRPRYGDYAGTISVNGKVLWRFDELRGARAGFRGGFAPDHANAYDEMAASAVAFGSNLTSLSEYDDADSEDERRDMRDAMDAISEATMWAMDEQGHYFVARSFESNRRNVGRWVG